MSELLIRNGAVFDPHNRVAGDVMDIAVKDGKVTSSASLSSPQVIDAKGMMVMPGGICGHTHICGGKVNIGRMMRPEDGRRSIEVKGKITRSGVGRINPTTHLTGYRYSKMGYTTAMEAAQPPLETRHTHEEILATPMLDKGALTLFGSNWSVMKYLEEDDIERATAYVAWLLKATRGYAIKIVNPGGVEAWGFGKNVRSLQDTVPRFEITPAKIIRGLVEINERLGLPHSIHIHPNNLGVPGNVETTLETLEQTSDITSRCRQTMHLTHIQFHSYGGTSWKDFNSQAPQLAKYVNEHDNVTVDFGQVIIANTTTMTADGPMEFSLHQLTHNKWSNDDVELEPGGGIIPVTYSRKSPVSVVQWAIGLEMMLSVKDPMKIFLSTDHPNGGPFTYYPYILAMLASRPYREAEMKRCHKAVYDRTTLDGLEREYTFAEIATATRTGWAKSLGLLESGKGHLGEGANADIAIYALDPATIDASRDYKNVECALGKAAYTIKDGEVVARDGEITAIPKGRTIYVEPQVDEKLFKEMYTDLEKLFRRYYSVNIANYPLQDEYVPNPYVVPSGVKV